jgi:hypothetical protein
LAECNNNTGRMCWAGTCHGCNKGSGQYCCSPGTPNQCMNGCNTSTGMCN